MHCACLMLCLLASHTASGQAQLGPVTYTVPSDWSVVGANDSLVLFEPNQLEEAEGLLLCLLLPSTALEPPSSALEQTWSEVLGLLTLEAVMDEGHQFRASPPVQTSDGRTLWLANGRGSDSSGTYDLRLYLLQERDHYLRGFVVANVLPLSIAYPPTSALYNPRFAYEIPGFILQLSTGADPVLPPRPVRSLAGLWRGLAMFGGVFKNAYAYFYPDGRVFFGSRMPMNGYEGLMADADAVITPAYWGRYSYDGQTGELQLPYQNTVFPFTPSGSRLTIVTTGTPHEFWEQPSVDGRIFQGTYFLQLASGEKPTLALSADGTFADHGLLKHVDNWFYPFRVSDNPGEGTYYVKNFTVVFRYSDGRVLKLPFSGLGLSAGDPSPLTLAIGTEDDTLTLAGGAGVQGPRLVISPDPGTGELKLRWPASAAGYVLQWTASLRSPSWERSTEVPTREDAENVVKIPPNAPSRFFRLVKQ